MTVEIVRIHPTEAKKMRRLHRHWSPGTDVPAGLGGAGTVGIVASSEWCCQVVWSTAVLGCGKASHGEVGQGAMVCSVT